MVLKCPMLLTSRWDTKTQPGLATLEGALGNRQAVVEAINKAPDLIASARDTIASNLRVLAKLGLPPEDVRSVVMRQPQLCAHGMASPAFQAKLRSLRRSWGDLRG